MPITRMDMMTMAPKTQESTSYKVAQNEKPVHEQTMLQNQQQKETVRNSQQTVRKDNAENPEYRYDAKEKGNGQYSQSKKKNSKKKDSNKTEENSSFDGFGHLDIRI